MEDRFTFEKDREDPFKWTVTDKEFGVSVRFEEGMFEATKELSFIPGCPQSPSPNEQKYIGDKCLRDIRQYLHEANLDLYLLPSFRKINQ